MLLEFQNDIFSGQVSSIGVTWNDLDFRFVIKQ